jgi:lipopolysaccharide transport system permease protein
MFIENANLIKKLSFPRICLPIIVVLNAGVNFAIIFGLFTVFLVASGNFPRLDVLGHLPGAAVQMLLAIGIGMVLGVLNVFFRDVGQFFTIAAAVLVLVHAHRLSGHDPAGPNAPLLAWNPMAAWCRPTRHPGEGPGAGLGSLLPVTVLALLLCMLGLRLFRKRAGEMVDEL